MKIMLTSFGIDQGEIDAGRYLHFSCHAIPPPAHSLANNWIRINMRYQPFRKMPPLDMRSIANGLAPEYSLLILCDKLVFDSDSFSYLTEYPDDPLFGAAGHTLSLLKREGFLELRDYRAILAENGDLLTRMTQNDLMSVGQWSDAMRNSSRIWREFVGSLGSFFDGAASRSGLNTKNLSDHVKQHDKIAAMLDAQPLLFRREKVSAYLSYVNANLILSNEMEAGLHDWEDFQPFYHRKFPAVGRENAELPALAVASRQLFDIAFPEFAIQSPEHFMKLLTHRRIGELRSLIEEASRGGVEFDENFARSVFHEVIGAERTLGKRRRLLGYLTFPIGFLPFVGNYAQFLAEQGAESLMERRLKKKFRWFYLLSDLADKESRRDA